MYKYVFCLDKMHLSEPQLFYNNAGKPVYLAVQHDM